MTNQGRRRQSNRPLVLAAVAVTAVTVALPVVVLAN